MYEEHLPEKHHVENCLRKEYPRRFIAKANRRGVIRPSEDASGHHEVAMVPTPSFHLSGYGENSVKACVQKVVDAFDVSLHMISTLSGVLREVAWVQYLAFCPGGNRGGPVVAGLV